MIDDIVSGYQSIFEHALLEVKSQIQESLLQDGVNSDIVPKALSSYESYDNLRLFSGLETAYLQRKYNIILSTGIWNVGKKL